MKVIAISALVLAACIIAYQLPAQSNPFERIVREDFGKSDQSRPRVDADANNTIPNAIANDRKLPPQPATIDFEVRATDLGMEFGKVLNAAIQDEVINAQQADRLLKELEVDLMIKRARLDLMRVVAGLDKAGEVTPGSPHAAEILKLRHQLKELVGELQQRSETVDPARSSGWSDAEPRDAGRREPVGGVRKLD